jgi:hypothetical protein
VKINNQIFSQTYNSFKIDLSKMHDLNATLLSDALLSDDLDKNTITNIFKANGFAPAVADSLEFSVQNIDDHNGSVDVLITKCNDKSSDKTYENQIFTIKNLKPYYIEQNKNIDKLFLHKKPSKILLADFKNYFIVESEAFKNKHQDDLSITLKPNDDEHSLVAEIQYNDNKTNQPIKVTYKYEMNYKTTF